MKHEHFGQLDEIVPHFRFVFSVATLTGEVVIDLVLCVVVLQALKDATLVLKWLRHKRIASEGLVTTFGALDDRLHDTREDVIYLSRVALLELLYYLWKWFLRVRAVKLWSLRKSLLILKLLKQVDHKLVAIVLHYRIKAPSEEHF